MALDPKTKQLLNDFSKSQPALNQPGEPADSSGVLLGDLIEAGGNPVAASVAALGALAPVTATDGTGTDAALATDVDARVASLQGKIDAILAALKAAGIMEA